MVVAVEILPRFGLRLHPALLVGAPIEFLRACAQGEGPVAGEEVGFVEAEHVLALDVSGDDLGIDGLPPAYEGV